MFSSTVTSKSVSIHFQMSLGAGLSHPQLRITIVKVRKASFGMLIYFYKIILEIGRNVLELLGFFSPLNHNIVIHMQKLNITTMSNDKESVKVSMEQPYDRAWPRNDTAEARSRSHCPALSGRTSSLPDRQVEAR